MTHYQLIFQTKLGENFIGHGFYKKFEEAEEVAGELRERLCGDEDSVIHWVAIESVVS